jgi:hypothetical protein
MNDWFLFFFIISYLEQGEIDLAEKQKARIEEAQRSRSTPTSGPKWFKQNEDSFVLIGDDDPSHSYWKKREENWTGVDFIQLWETNTKK